MEKLYFEDEDGEMCYSEDYFQQLMKDNENTEIEVYEAVKEKIAGIFWCGKLDFCGDKTFEYDNPCGKQCEEYAPRNGVSGCCRYYKTNLYYAGDKITLKLTLDEDK